METTLPIDGRSSSFTVEERKMFKKTVKDLGTMTNASRELKMSKNTIERIMLVGSGHPDTIQSIRKYWEAKNVA